jgi:beta-glucosidase
MGTSHRMYLNCVREVGGQYLTPEIYAAEISDPVQLALLLRSRMSELKDRASALVGNFGVGDAALLDVLTGVAEPEGKLPFELPSSMQEVEAQRSSIPHDTAHPLYRIGFGRGYSTKR